MRICLYWNSTAGGGISLERLTSIIAAAGHNLTRVVQDASELPSHLDDVDCVVAAGGDGTVARAGRALVGGPLPLAILPMGTANNIAASLAIRGDVEQLVARWRQGRIAKIDVGVIACGDGPDHFLESVGCGLVTRCIEVGKATLSKDDPDSHLDDARRLYLDTLRDLRPQRYHVALDGEEVTGEFLLVEALNTPSIGPKLELAEHASAADGFLSVVAVTESDREMLTAYLTALHADAGPVAAFKSWRARSITITGAHQIHVDDRVIDAGGAVALALRPLSLSILA